MRNDWIAAAVVLGSLAGLAEPPRLQAQDRSSLVLQGTAGAREDIVESACRGGPQNSFGGSVHYYITERTNIGGEVLWFRRCSQNFTYYAPRTSGMLQIAHDFSEGRFRPYLIGGIGTIYHQSGYARPFYRFDAAAGGGIKIFATKRIFIAPEVLAGTGGHLTIRFSANAGIVLR